MSRVLFESNRTNFYRLLSGAAVVQGLGMGYFSYITATEMRVSSDSTDRSPLWQRAVMASAFGTAGVAAFGAMWIVARRSVRRMVLSPCQQQLEIATYDFGGSRKPFVAARKDCFIPASVNVTGPVISFKVVPHRGFFLIDTSKADVCDRAAIHRVLTSPSKI
jgi:hypothetical protein